MTTYQTRDGDVLDEICWRYYGRADVVPQVLEANPGLADLGTVYDAGRRITLPSILPPARQPISLWD